MAIAQDSFDLFRGRAYEGQVSTIEVAEIISRRVEDDHIENGRAVIRGTDKRSCAPIGASSTAADIIGFSVRSAAQASPTSPANGVEYKIGYPVGFTASLLRRGSMFVKCVDGALAGDPVIVITAAGDDQGRLTAGGTGITLDYVKWVDDVVAGEIGEIQVDGIFAAATSSEE